MIYDNKENVIREKRTNQATKKNLMGPSGKFGVILQAYGHPVIRQGSGLVDMTFMQDPYGDDVYTEYGSTLSGQNGPVAYRDEILDSYDEYTHTEGLMFDGLSRGMHLDIIYWHVNGEIKVTYRGYLVYREVSGFLDGYAPFDDWEDLVNRLYDAAKEKLKVRKKTEEIEMSQMVEGNKKHFWDRVRMKWGV